MGDEGCKVVCDSLKGNASLARLNIAANSAGKVRRPGLKPPA